jgi:hypothetical protein
MAEPTPQDPHTMLVTYDYQQRICYMEDRVWSYKVAQVYAVRLPFGRRHRE